MPEYLEAPHPPGFSNALKILASATDGSFSRMLIVPLTVTDFRVTFNFDTPEPLRWQNGHLVGQVDLSNLGTSGSTITVNPFVRRTGTTQFLDGWRSYVFPRSRIELGAAATERLTLQLDAPPGTTGNHELILIVTGDNANFIAPPSAFAVTTP